jgi:hypothetical protein
MTIPDQLTAAIAALDEELWSIGESSDIARTRHGPTDGGRLRTA